MTTLLVALMIADSAAPGRHSGQRSALDGRAEITARTARAAMMAKLEGLEVLYSKISSSAYLLTLLLITSAREVRCGKDYYTFPDSVTLKDGDEFEYIVVGAGGAGAAVAARLALAGKDVLLVEAGGNPTELSKIPSLAQALLGSSLDYQYETISNNVSCLSFINHQCRFSRGKCLGGSTSINYMIYTRGCPDDFDDYNITGWTWKDIMPYFLRYEGLQDLDLLPPSSIPFHNTSGTMKIEFFTGFDNPWRSRFIEGLMSLNFPLNPDVNAKSEIGVTQVVGYVYKDERMSTARGYLARDDVKRKLKVTKYTKCTSVIIDNDNVARGITVVVGGGLFQRKLRLFATKEVILSAGTIATPQILMLSGIGPAQHLSDMNIPVRVDLPVGDNMFDHAAPLMFVKVGNKKNIVDKTADLLESILKSPNPNYNYITDITVFVNTKCYDFDKRQLMNDSVECQLPTMQMHLAFLNRWLLDLGGPIAQNGGNFGDYLFKQLSDLNAKHVLLTISPDIVHPKSRGTVRLASRDPFDAPAVFPNFLSDENDEDLEEMIRAIRLIEHLVETPVFKANNASVVWFKLDGCPEYEVDSEEYRRCYARHMTQSGYHATGTSALGRVVDERLRVYGVQRLRVADVGVMPRPPRANTASSAIAIGEKAYDLIMEANNGS